MKAIWTFLFAGTFLFACSEAAPTAEEQSETEEKKEAITVIPNRLLMMEVSGMSCEMACGGAIREGLIETGAVSRVQFDFEMGRDENVAKISFDKDKITVDEMIQIVSKLNDNQFTVGETKSESLPESEIVKPKVETSSSEESHSNDHANVEVKSTSFELPNLFNILSDLVVG